MLHRRAMGILAALALFGAAQAVRADEPAPEPRFSFAGMTLAEAIAAPDPALDVIKRPQIEIRRIVNVPVKDVRGPGTWRTTLDQVHRLSHAADVDQTALLDALKARADSLPPPYLFEISRREMETDTPAGLHWLALGQLRTVYDGLRCADPSVEANIPATMIDLHPVSEEARDASYRKAEIYADALRKLTGGDAVFAGSASPWWICSSGIAALRAASDGRELARSDWLKPETAWSRARAVTLDNAQLRLIEAMSGQ